MKLSKAEYKAYEKRKREAKNLQRQEEANMNIIPAEDYTVGHSAVADRFNSNMMFPYFMMLARSLARHNNMYGLPRKK